jgi:hypothetical protein
MRKKLPISKGSPRGWREALKKNNGPVSVLPQRQREQVTEIANLDVRSAKPEHFATLKNFLHDLVGILANELQVAADGPKSALRPDDKVIGAVLSLVNYREVAWLDKYKNAEVYKLLGLSVSSHSPIDKMAVLVNQHWSQQQLAPRPHQEFRPLFISESQHPDIKVKVKKINDTYNHLNSRYMSLLSDFNEYSGGRIELISPRGNKLEVVNLGSSLYPDIDNLMGKEGLSVQLQYQNNKYQVKILEPQSQKFVFLGNLSRASIAEHKATLDKLFAQRETPELTLNANNYSPPFNKKDLESALRKVRAYCQEVYESITPEERKIYAAELWHLLHARTDGTEKTKDFNFKTGSSVFNIFPKEIEEQLGQLNFTALKANQIYLYHYKDTFFTGESLPLEVGFRDGQRTLEVAGKTLGTFTQDSPKLPVGTKATASLNTLMGAAAIATLEGGAQLKINAINQNYYADVNFQETRGLLKIVHWEKGFLVKLDNQNLGFIRDQESVAQLGQGKIPIGIELPVSLTRDAPKIVNVNVDPLTVSYPEKQLHDQSRSAQEAELLPTVWIRQDQGFIFAVDETRQKAFSEFFSNQGVSFVYQPVPPERTSGYVVAKVDSLSNDLYEKLVKKLGNPLDSQSYLDQPLPQVSEVTPQVPETTVQPLPQVPEVKTLDPLEVYFPDISPHRQPYVYANENKLTLFVDARELAGAVQKLEKYPIKLSIELEDCHLQYGYTKITIDTPYAKDLFEIMPGSNKKILTADESAQAVFQESSEGIRNLLSKELQQFYRHWKELASTNRYCNSQTLSSSVPSSCSNPDENKQKSRKSR